MCLIEWGQHLSRAVTGHLHTTDADKYVWIIVDCKDNLKLVNEIQSPAARQPL